MFKTKTALKLQEYCVQYKKKEKWIITISPIKLGTFCPGRRDVCRSLWAKYFQTHIPNLKQIRLNLWTKNSCGHIKMTKYLFSYLQLLKANHSAPMDEMVAPWDSLVWIFYIQLHKIISLIPFIKGGLENVPWSWQTFQLTDLHTSLHLWACSVYYTVCIIQCVVYSVQYTVSRLHSL